MIEVNTATKTFGGRVVLDGAGLWAHRGEITSLLGRNGCGKTTLHHRFKPAYLGPQF